MANFNHDRLSWDTFDATVHMIKCSEATQNKAPSSLQATDDDTHQLPFETPSPSAR